MVSFQEMIAHFFDRHLRHATTQADYRRIHKQYFAGWCEHPSRVEVKRWHEGLRECPAHANKALGFLKSAYNWAANDGLWEGPNPAQGIKRHPTYSRERVMDLREVRLVLNALDFLNPKYDALLTCRITTPGRITELCGMPRASVDLHTGKWTKTRTKNGRPHVIHIPRQAREKLAALPVEGDYFFMGQYGRPLTPCAARKIWGKLRADLHMPDVWLLDFRRTLATYLYRVQQVDDLTAKAVLNHYDARPVAIYTRLDYDYLADLIQGYADWLFSLGGHRHEQANLFTPRPARTDRPSLGTIPLAW